MLEEEFLFNYHIANIKCSRYKCFAAQNKYDNNNWFIWKNINTFDVVIILNHSYLDYLPFGM